MIKGLLVGCYPDGDKVLNIGVTLEGEHLSEFDEDTNNTLINACKSAKLEGQSVFVVIKEEDIVNSEIFGRWYCDVSEYLQ